jgi:multidrug resistance efflux pump
MSAFVRDQPGLPMRLSIVSLLLLLVFSGPVRADIWECVDSNGNRRFTNVRAEAAGCKPMNLPPVQTVPPPKPAAKGANAKAQAGPGNFPKVDAPTQQQRDADRRKILEQELASEQKLLDQARKELAEQEAIRLGSERNYQRVLDRLEPFKKKVALHESNIANLRKEISSLR